MTCTWCSPTWPCRIPWTKVACQFYVYGSVHRWSLLIAIRRDAAQSSLFIILQVHSTCFGCQPRWREVAAQKIWPVPETVVTVLCTPDYRCGWHPKHVEWTCRIINRLLCVASRWAISNINRLKFGRNCIKAFEIDFYRDLLLFNNTFL
jgi:hypothetical protein